MANENNDDLTLSYEAPLEMPPEGRHPMICVDAFETWPEEETWDNVTSTKKKLMFVFQVFPEDGSKDSEGDVYRLEHKINMSLTPPSANFNASGLWTLLENWTGQPLSRKSVNFKPASLIGKTAWGTIEHKTRYARLSAIEPYVNEAGNALLAPKAGAYERRTYPDPATWKNKKESAPRAQPVSSGNPYDPIPGGADLKDALPF